MADALHGKIGGMSLHAWLLYLAAAIGLSLSPGPNTLLALTHGAMHGWRRTLFTIAGGALGFAIVVALAMFGIGALLKTSLTWFTVMKWVGGIYLIWLGIQVWRAPPVGATLNIDGGSAALSVRGRSLFAKGALSAVSNPKAILFFVAFLPQFIDPARSLLLQFAIMTGTFVVIEVITELIIAAMAHRISPWLRRVGRRFNQVCGGVFMAIGAALPLRA